MTEITLQQLRTIDLFDELEDDELAPWIAVTELREYAAGDVVVEFGAEAPAFFMLLAGDLRNITVEGGREEVLGTQHAPTWLGAIPVLTETPIGARLEALTPALLGRVGGEDFTQLALSQRAVHRKVMLAVRPVTARIAQRELSRSHLESLGTMAAGLAHELNNPAAAARRGAAALNEALDVIGNTLGYFVDSGFELEQARQLVSLQREITDGAGERSALSALDASDAEDELLDTLEEYAIDEAWRLAEPLAAGGADADWLARVHAVAGDATGDVLRWVAALLTASGLTAELCESTERMSKLVAAIKAYAYMDRGELVEADIHEGLETTLAVLGHKLKHTQIEIVREYDRTIPKATIHGAELNQVWTNLIDNAIAAVGERGTITLRTRLDGDCVEVDVADSGPGIPDDVMPRLFEPFFTTKEVGQGTGLGLDTARRIVGDRHGGSLWAANRPEGGAVFHVRVPLRSGAATA